MKATADDGSTKSFSAMVRIDTPEELTAFSHGGILPYVLRQLVEATSGHEPKLARSTKLQGRSWTPEYREHEAWPRSL